VYAFTTENIGGYLPSISRPEMRVLCVASSGDHLLNSVYFGACGVTVFDLNTFALYWTELKLIAAATLSLDDFKSFFFRDISDSPLSAETYECLRKALRPSAKRFFDGLFARYARDGSELRRSNLFHSQNDSDARALASNPYLFSADAFRTLKLRLQTTSVKWLRTCITKLSDTISAERFDLVLLSNISDYISELGFGEHMAIEPLNRYVREIIAPLLPQLEREGEICAAYLYCVDTTGCHGERVRGAIHCRKSRLEAFDQCGFRLREVIVPSIFPEEMDLVCVVNRKHVGSVDPGTPP
jgi:hypothetical protein